MKINKYFNWLAFVTLVMSSTAFTSCVDEPDKFELSGGTPEIKYIRVADAASGDSLIEAGYMESTICIVGNNLKSIKEMYFNDKKAVLNTSYVTDHTIFVDIPSSIPELVSNKIFMVNKDNDTTSYAFHVIVPTPTVSSMRCEYAAPGDTVTVKGDYFINDAKVPLKITMNGGALPVTDIKNISKTALTFTIPEGAKSGYMNVTTIYGTSRSKFQYKDPRNILFDWDGSHGGHAIAHGWRDGSKVIKKDNTGIDGAYIEFSGSMAGGIGTTWDEDDFSFNYWPEPSKGYEELSSRTEFADMLKKYDISKLQIKFEARIPNTNPWKASALQMIFSSNNAVTYSTGSNGYFSNTAIPRGLWIPWQSSSSYDTAGSWITVTIPLSSFNKTHAGATCANALSIEDFTGLTFFVWNGGIAGTDCTPKIDIDNIRVVPIE